MVASVKKGEESSCLHSTYHILGESELSSVQQTFIKFLLCQAYDRCRKKKINKEWSFSYRGLAVVYVGVYF